MRRAALALTGGLAATLAAACGAPDRAPAMTQPTLPANAATAAAANEGSAAPAAAARDRADLLAWLRATYGPDARLAGEWTDPDGRRRHVCARGGDRGRAPWPALVAVCADAPECMAPGDGATDFYAFVRTDTGIRAEMQAREVASGANGCAGEVDVVRFGRERWGFVLHGGTTSQGYVIGWASLRTFRAGRLEELALVNTVFDNNGAACEAEDCREVGISINSDLRFDARDPDADAWPLVVHQSGVECFLNIDRTQHYDFDAARFRYAVPDGPPDVACPPVASP
jgi:hypothetical protein